MHIATKLTLGLGGILLIGSIVAMVVGGGSFMEDFVDNPNGTEKWQGDAPTTYEGNFSVYSLYFVFIEDGSTIDVELVNGDNNSRFIPCTENEDCEFYGWAGYTYIGDISVYEEGTWSVEFTGSGKVMIRETTIDVGGAMAMSGGFFGICCSCFILILGFIFIFTLKDKAGQQGLVMVQQADGTIQPVGGGIPGQQQITQQSAVPMVGGAIHPAYAAEQPVIQPVQQSQTLPPLLGQQPPNQGF
jgi:hypothetical protein